MLYRIITKKVEFTRMLKYLAAHLLLAALPLASPVLAQMAGLQGSMPAGIPPTGPLQVHQLAPTVYWVQGGIGNAGFIVGDKGVIVIDTTISPASGKELLADIASITPKPVSAVILTHGDPDHTGGLAAFPANIAIFAQENNLKRMAADAASGHSRVPADHLPNRSVNDRQSVVLEGVKIDLLHWAPAHTDGDLVIFLPAEKIVFTGDIFCLDQPRALIHLEQQGSSEGWITTAKDILALDATQFVVGHGEVQGKAALEERVKLVVAEKAQIKTLISNGKSLAEIQAAVGDPPVEQAKPEPGGPRFAPFSEVVYREETGKQ